MIGALREYRDDGLLAEAAGRLRLPVPSLAITYLALIVLAAGLVTGAAGGPYDIASIVGFVVLALVGGAGRPHERLQWLVPPGLRIGEYAAIGYLAWWGDPATFGPVYALLSVLAFHHYDIVYRLRHQQVAPPRRVRLLGGGWDGRLIVVLVCALAGALGPAVFVLLGWCGLLYVTDSVASWIRVGRDERREFSHALQLEEELDEDVGDDTLQEGI